MLQLFLVQVTVVKAVGYFPDRVVLAAVLVMDRVVQVVPLETQVETEPVVVMTLVDLLTLSGGGGGWGANGGGNGIASSGAAGKPAIFPDGNTYTLSDSGTIYGSTS